LNFYHDCKEELAKGASLILVCAQHGHLAGGRCNSEAEVQAKGRIDCCGGFLPFEESAVNDSNAQTAVIRKQRGNRPDSDPERSFEANTLDMRVR